VAAGLFPNAYLKRALNSTNQSFAYCALRCFILAILCAHSLSLPAQTTSPPDQREAQGASAPASQGKKGTDASISPEQIANQVNNPAAPVTLIQFRNILIPDTPGANGVVNSLQMQPVVPVGPFKHIPFVQLIKITLPLYVNNPGLGNVPTQATGESGLGDMQLFDLVSIKQSWGRWGFGPALVLPTATGTSLGAGKWQAGPAVALIYTGVHDLTAGVVVQNPISIAGDRNRPEVNQMLITPTFTFNWSHGWFAGMSDYNWSFNWENGGATTIPLGVQFGKVVRIGRQPVSLSVQAGGTVLRPAGTPKPGLILGFELSPVFNFHLGPKEKVRLRK
jgi:hypothetical protein